MFFYKKTISLITATLFFISIILSGSIISVKAMQTNIMGNSSTSQAQMVNYFNGSGRRYPVFYQTNGGAPNIETFCRMYIEEAESENVRAEVAFTQSMKETGFLQFGGDVSIHQFNFCGLGATGNNAPGLSFPDARTGTKAHIQHLKAYASKETLRNACVDGRFNIVQRGCIPYVEWLGIQENFKRTGSKFGWAASAGYGYDIVRMMQELGHYPGVSHLPYFSAKCDKISIVKSSTNSSTFTVIAEGVRGNNSIAKVRFPIFKNGQLISWQEGTYLGHEAWAFSYNALSQPGSYGVHVYVGDIHGSEVCAGSTGAQDEIAVLQGAQTANNVVYSKKSDSCVSLFSVIAEGVSGAGNAAVHFAFSPPGQAFSWNGAKYTGANTWVLTFNATLNGVYNIHSYRDINRSCIGAIQFASQIENPTMEKFEFTKSGANNQKLTVKVSGLKSVRGVASVKFPIFRNGQLQGWYDATCIGEGIWSLDYNATNNPGSYGAHVYVYDRYGYGVCVHSTGVNDEVAL